ncbi:RNA-directed DNA polymerase, eukaryota, reverse transcriptase zinc-binding domain protein [Tanacetum coccineum]
MVDMDELNRNFFNGNKRNEAKGTKGDVWRKKDVREEVKRSVKNNQKDKGETSQSKDGIGTGNKYDVLNILDDDNEELEILKGRIIVDSFIAKEIQPNGIEVKEWTNDMIKYFKDQKKLKKFREEEGGNEEIKDVLETNSGIASELNAEEVRGIERRSLWNDLRSMKRITYGYPWILMGDFNVTLKIEEHSTGGSRSSGDMQDFVDCVNDIEVEDVNQAGLFFTWIKSPSKPVTSIMKKLDRPCEEFNEVVKHNWKCDHDGYNMYKLVKKMKNLKSPLKKLAWKNGNLFQYVKTLEEELKKAQILVEANPFDAKVKEDMANILQNYNEALNDEEKLLAQKAKVGLVKEIEIPNIFTMWLKAE